MLQLSGELRRFILILALGMLCIIGIVTLLLGYQLVKRQAQTAPPPPIEMLEGEEEDVMYLLQGKKECKGNRDCLICRKRVECLSCMNDCYNRFGSLEQGALNALHEKNMACNTRCWATIYEKKITPGFDINLLRPTTPQKPVKGQAISFTFMY